MSKPPPSEVRHSECCTDDLICIVHRACDDDNVCRNKWHRACVLRPEEQHPHCRAVNGACLVGPRCSDCSHGAYMEYDCWKDRGKCLDIYGNCRGYSNPNQFPYEIVIEDEEETN